MFAIALSYVVQIANFFVQIIMPVLYDNFLLLMLSAYVYNNFKYYSKYLISLFIMMCYIYCIYTVYVKTNTCTICNTTCKFTEKHCCECKKAYTAMMMIADNDFYTYSHCDKCHTEYNDDHGHICNKLID